MTYKDPLVEYCKARGLKLNREVYIAGAYPDGTPTPGRRSSRSSFRPSSDGTAREFRRPSSRATRSRNGPPTSPPTTPYASMARSGAACLAVWVSPK